MVHDGTVTWIIDDIRDCTPIGSVRGSLYLPAGYIKANGATVQRADYPRLVACVEAHSLWTNDTAAHAGLFGRGDGSTTMVVPNWIDRMAQYAADGAGAVLEAGLPNITGKIYGKFAKGGQSGSLFNLNIGYDGRASKSEPNEGWYEGTAGFDASKSNATYGKSATVQPAAIKVIPIIRY